MEVLPDMNELYKSKLVTAKEAAKVVKSGNWVDYGWTVTTPVDFDKERSRGNPPRKFHPNS